MLFVLPPLIGAPRRRWMGVDEKLEMIAVVWLWKSVQKNEVSCDGLVSFGNDSVVGSRAIDRTTRTEQFDVN